MHSCAAVLLCVAAWILVPDIESNVRHWHTGIIRDAVAAYKAENGRYAASLIEVEPYLEASTRTDCLITEEGPGDYRVVVPLGNGKTHYMHVAYVLTGDGELETLYVQLTDTKRTR